MKWKTGRQKREPKVKRQNESLKVSSLPSFGFFLVVFLCVLSSLCLRKEKKDNTVTFFSLSKKMMMAQQCAIVFFFGGVKV
jgi:hypothetical protein